MTARTLRAIGVDVGTSALKAVRVATAGGRVTVEAVASEPYTRSRRPSRSPKSWLVAAGRALETVIDGPIETIGFTGQMHALVPVRGGRSLGQTMLWLDMAGAPYLGAFVRAHPHLSLLRRTGNIPLPDFTLAKWLALRDQSPVLAAQVETLPAAKDFVRNAFVADGPAVTDVNEAAGAQWFDPFKHSWDDAICTAAGIPSSALSRVVDPTVVIGCNTSRRLPIGVPVIAGAGDQQTAARAHGSDRIGRVSLSLGTSGVVAAPWRLDRLPADWDGAFHLFPTDMADGYQVIATIPALAGAFHWAARLLGVDLAGLVRLAATARSGAPATARFFPYLAGSGAPHPDASRRAQLRGLSEASTRVDVAAAVIDGVAAEIACQISEMRMLGVPIDEVVLSGGMASVDPLARRIAGYVEVPVWRSTVAEGSAVGAALLALEGLGASTGARASSTRVRPPASERRGVEDTWLTEREAILQDPIA